MSFAILRHAKISSASKGGAIAHNHRLVSGEQINIDGALGGLNRFFFGPGAKARIDEKLPEKMRKDAIVSVELLLTASPEFFDGLEKDRTKLSKHPVFLDWVNRTKKWAEVEFGKNLVDLVLHMDESTPHFHALAVPLTKDGRLCAKEVTARTEMQRRQTDYARAMDKFGLKRGDPASETKRRHIGLKEAPGSGGQASQLAAQLAATKADLEKAQVNLANQKKLNIENFHLINRLEGEIKELKALKGALKAPETAQEALPKEWAAIPMATTMDALYGTPVAIYGRQVVLHIGRGKYVLHTVQDGHELPKLEQAQQNKPGISR